MRRGAALVGAVLLVWAVAVAGQTEDDVVMTGDSPSSATSSSTTSSTGTTLLSTGTVYACVGSFTALLLFVSRHERDLVVLIVVWVLNLVVFKLVQSTLIWNAMAIGDIMLYIHLRRVAEARLVEKRKRVRPRKKKTPS